VSIVNFLGMGPLELLLIMALALIVFGPDKLPDIARQLGRTIGEFRRMSSDVRTELQRNLQLDEDVSHRPGPRPGATPPSYTPPSPPSQPRPDDVQPPY
jgi:Tat protein translocase TatB subunit